MDQVDIVGLQEQWNELICVFEDFCSAFTMCAWKLLAFMDYNKKEI